MNLHCMMGKGGQAGTLLIAVEGQTHFSSTSRDSPLFVVLLNTRRRFTVGKHMGHGGSSLTLLQWQNIYFSTPGVAERLTQGEDSALNITVNR